MEWQCFFFTRTDVPRAHLIRYTFLSDPIDKLPNHPKVHFSIHLIVFNSCFFAKKQNETFDCDTKMAKQLFMKYS